MASIDHRKEVLFPINEVPARLEKLSGHKVHVSAVYRWVASGLLDAIRLGGRAYCSEQSLDRFVERCNLPADRCRSHVVAAARSDFVSHARAENELDALGL